MPANCSKNIVKQEYITFEIAILKFGILSVIFNSCNAMLDSQFILCLIKCELDINVTESTGIQGFKGTVVNRALPSLHGCSLMFIGHYALQML